MGKKPYRFCNLRKLKNFSNEKQLTLLNQTNLKIAFCGRFFHLILHK